MPKHEKDWPDPAAGYQTNRFGLTPGDNLRLSLPCTTVQAKMTEATGDKILAKIESLERRLDMVFGNNVVLGGCFVSLNSDFLTCGDLNESTSRAAKLQFDKLIKGRR